MSQQIANQISHSNTGIEVKASRLVTILGLVTNILSNHHPLSSRISTRSKKAMMLDFTAKCSSLQRILHALKTNNRTPGVKMEMIFHFLGLIVEIKQGTSITLLINGTHREWMDLLLIIARVWLQSIQMIGDLKHIWQLPCHHLGIWKQPFIQEGSVPKARPWHSTEGNNKLVHSRLILQGLSISRTWRPTRVKWTPRWKVRKLLISLWWKWNKTMMIVLCSRQTHRDRLWEEVRHLKHREATNAEWIRSGKRSII